MKYLVVVFFIGCAYGSAIIQHPKIVGGGQTSSPYHAALKSLPKNKFHCSAAIISDAWLVTAGWCTSLRPKEMTVVVGTNTLDDSGYSYAVSRVVVHPDFDNQNGIWTNDNIGLIKIAGYFTFDGYNIKPISLSSYLRLPLGLRLRFTGWGTTKYPPEGEGTSDVLQGIYLKSITIKKCEEFFQTLNFTHLSFHCTAADEGKGPCYKDQGGPLVISRNDELVGIEHSGFACTSSSRGNPPNLFTNVGPHRLWIEQITGV